jgi:hypothetical protein
MPVVNAPDWILKNLGYDQGLGLSMVGTGTLSTLPRGGPMPVVGIGTPSELGEGWASIPTSVLNKYMAQGDFMNPLTVRYMLRSAAPEILLETGPMTQRGLTPTMIIGGERMASRPPFEAGLALMQRVGRDFLRYFPGMERVIDKGSGQVLSSVSKAPLPLLPP